MSAHNADAVSSLVGRSRAQQGLPEHIDDPAVIGKVAALLSTAIRSRNHDSAPSRDMNHTEQLRSAPDEPQPPARPTPDMGISKEDPQ